MPTKPDKEWEDAFHRDKEALHTQISMITESALNQTMRKGLLEGKKKYKQALKRKGAYISFLAAACMLILFTVSIRVSPAFASAVREIPVLSKFANLIQYDSLFAEATRKGYLQEVGLSSTSGKSKLTLGSILADEERILLLYSIQGAAITKDNHFDFELLDEQGNKLGEVLGGTDLKNYDEALETYEKVDFRLLDGKTMPEHAVFRASAAGYQYEIPFHIDRERFAGQKEVIEVNKTVEVDGQKAHINYVTITPLQAKVFVTADPDNTMQLNDIVDFRLNDDTGYRRKPETMKGDLRTGEKVYYFESPYFREDIKSLTLEAKGLVVSKPGQVFTFNTETLETIQTPDSHIVLDKVEETGDQIEIRISAEGIYEQTKNPYINPYVQFFNEDNTFTDAAGSEYSMNGANLLMWPGHDNGSHMTFSIPKREYKQPLSFNVKEYPGYVKGDINIKIK